MTTPTDTPALTIPHRNDPCWHDRAWRTRTFREAMDTYGISPQQAMRWLGRKPNTVYVWRSGEGEWGAIPIHTLRAFLFELREELTADHG